MTSSDKHLGKLEARLRHWGAKLDELVTRGADAVDSEVMVDYQKRIDDFRVKHQAAQAKLAEYRAAGTEKWDHFKSGIESSWSELENAFRELKQHAKR